MQLETDRPWVLRQAIMACRKGGTLSIPGVYGGRLYQGGNDPLRTAVNSRLGSGTTPFEMLPMRPRTAKHQETL